MYHSLWSNSSNNTHVGCAARLEFRSGSYTECTTDIFPFAYTRSVPRLPTTHSPASLCISEISALHQSSCIDDLAESSASLYDFNSTRRKPSSSGSVPASNQLIVDQNTTVLHCFRSAVCGSVIECDVVVRDLVST